MPGGGVATTFSIYDSSKDKGGNADSKYVLLIIKRVVGNFGLRDKEKSFLSIFGVNKKG
jgi:hypothetical protein